MTNYSELVKANRIKAGRFSQKQVLDCLNLAERDIATAKKIIAENADWGYNIAYNAMLQAARAVMFSKGYRVTGERQHATTIQFAQISLGDKFNSTIEFMDRMRRKRNRAVYDMAGIVSSKEASEAIVTAENFVSAILEILKS
jgi:uncharacterized protein (UPF0332 family)